LGKSQLTEKHSEFHCRHSFWLCLSSDYTQAQTTLEGVEVAIAREPPMALHDAQTRDERVDGLAHRCTERPIIARCDYRHRLILCTFRLGSNSRD
jgi:hypothetical protein